MLKHLNLIHCQVKSKCVLKGTTAKCAGNILRTSDTDCRDVDVEYRFKICNYDNEKVKLKGGTFIFLCAICLFAITFMK